MAKGFLSGLGAGLVLVAGFGALVSQLAPPVLPATPALTDGADAAFPVEQAATGADQMVSLSPVAGAVAPDGAVVPVATAPVTPETLSTTPVAADPPVLAADPSPAAPVPVAAIAPETPVASTIEPAAPIQTVEPVAPAAATDRAALRVPVPRPGDAPAADGAPAPVASVPPQPATAQIVAAQIAASLTVASAPAEIPAPAASRDQPAAAGKPPGMRLPIADSLADSLSGARAPAALAIPVVGTEPAPAPLLAPVNVAGTRARTEALAEIGRAAAAPTVPGADPMPLADAAPASVAPDPRGVILAEAGTDDAAAAAQPEKVETLQPAEKPKLLELVKPGMPGSATAPKPGFGALVPGVRMLAPDRALTPPDAAVEPDAAAEALPAFRRNAAPCANPDGKPVFSVILIDDGTGDPAKLTGLGFPVTVALDPTAAGVAAAEAAYREAGLEVVILSSALPEGATAADLEVTFQSYFHSLPGAVAVLDLPLAGVQGNRVMAQQMVAFLGAGGFGLVTLDRGLDPAAQVATRERVAQARIFRELDAAGENVATIRRYLDRAAFRAAQEGSVVVLGIAQDATLQALVEWAAEGRAGNMALCPVTGVMAAG